MLQAAPLNLNFSKCNSGFLRGVVFCRPYLVTLVNLLCFACQATTTYCASCCMCVHVCVVSERWKASHQAYGHSWLDQIKVQGGSWVKLGYKVCFCVWTCCFVYVRKDVDFILEMALAIQYYIIKCLDNVWFIECHLLCHRTLFQLFCLSSDSLRPINIPNHKDIQLTII